MLSLHNMFEHDTKIICVDEEGQGIEVYFNASHNGHKPGLEIYAYFLRGHQTAKENNRLLPQTNKIMCGNLFPTVFKLTTKEINIM
jgi:hypothetical protein